MSENNSCIVGWILRFQPAHWNAIFAFFKDFNFYIIAFRWLVRPIDEKSIVRFDFPYVIF